MEDAAAERVRRRLAVGVITNRTTSTVAAITSVTSVNKTIYDHPTQIRSR